MKLDEYPGVTLSISAETAFSFPSFQSEGEFLEQETSNAMANAAAAINDFIFLYLPFLLFPDKSCNLPSLFRRA